MKPFQAIVPFIVVTCCVIWAPPARAEGGSGCAFSSHALACAVAPDPQRMYHGIAGDERFVFAGYITPVPPAFGGGVQVYRRGDWKLMGELPAPPDGFHLPFTLEMDSIFGDQCVALLDTGGFPVGIPQLHTYCYEYSWWGGFSAQLVNSISIQLPFGPVGFVSDLEILNGVYVLSDQAIGQLLIADPASGTVTVGIGPEPPACPTCPPGLIPQLAASVYPPGHDFQFDTRQGVIDFSFAAVDPSGFTFAPGANYMAAKHGTLHWSSLNQQKIFHVSVSTLFDQSVPPWSKAVAIGITYAVAPLPSDIDDERILVGLAFDPSTDDDYLYVADPQSTRIGVVNTVTGQYQEVIRNKQVFNGPVTLQVAPSLLNGVTHLLVANDQEYCLPGVNGLISQPCFDGPWELVTMAVAPASFHW